MKTKLMLDAERVRQENSEVQQLMATLLRVVCERNEPKARVCHLFEALQERVKAHFKDEEEPDGVFDQAVQRDGELKPQCDVLREEHHSLTTDLRRIVGIVEQDACSPDWWADLEQECHDFSAKLQHHEFAENELIQRAWCNRDVDA